MRFSFSLFICNDVFLLLLKKNIWSLPAPHLITLTFPSPRWCSRILKVYAAFAREQHIKHSELASRWDSFWISSPKMFESETIIVWLHSQKTATNEYFMLNFFPAAYRCSLLYNTAPACGEFLRRGCKSLQVCQNAELALCRWDQVKPENKQKKKAQSVVL